MPRLSDEGHFRVASAILMKIVMHVELPGWLSITLAFSGISIYFPFVENHGLSKPITEVRKWLWAIRQTEMRRTSSLTPGPKTQDKLTRDASFYPCSFLDLCLLDICVGDALFNGLQSGIFRDLYHWLGSHFHHADLPQTWVVLFPFKVKFDFYLMINWKRSTEILYDYLRRCPMYPSLASNM